MKQLLLMLVFLCSCAAKNFTKEHDNNITEANNFKNFDEYESSNYNEELTEVIAENFEKKANIKVKEININLFCKVLAKLFNKNIYADNQENFTTKISFNLNNVTFKQILKHLALVYNIGFEEVGEDFIIYPPKRKTKMFQVNYHNFDRKSSSAIKINSTSLESGNSNKNNGGFSSIETTSHENFWANVEAMLNTILVKDFDIEISELLNIKSDFVNTKDAIFPKKSEINENLSIATNNGLIMVRAYPKTMAFIQEYIDTLNKSLMEQIMIEIKILEISLNEKFESGIQWNILKDKFNISFNQGGVNPNGSLDILTGAINNKQFSTFINALASQGKISVLSSPMINTLNNQRALIKFGEDKFFVTNINNVSFANTTNINAITSGYEFKSFFSGIALDTTPSIKSDNKILMHVHPIISRVTSDDVIVQVENKKTSLPMAKVQSREADSIILASSGNIIVLGGITESSFTSNTSELPFDNKHLKKINNLIKNDKSSKIKKELIILLKPTIIRNNNINMKSNIGFK